MSSISFSLQTLTTILSLSTVSAFPNVKRAPTPPFKDDFYSLPKGYEKAPLGEFLRHREPPGPLAAFGNIPLNLHSAYQI
ncbi:hypothetical protein ONS95_010148 [Cadophora gregata]|uniref:uncharacterized protein n=1 Tax=Cadophora gregata TaxID=51156 RepID=UPI0026DDC483|nr:uncharacterized protein ONS95_010148 [Cadophora gregata]KAK0121869.1 hypothetical protein ONS95_010148 [Cadophora gregata]KAK0127345.1 hypothetical protein ONS96_006894 [Cadophora gregata f. sp. sojae]